MSTPEEQLVALKTVLKECYIQLEDNLDGDQTWIVIDGHGWFDASVGAALAEVIADPEESE